MNMEPVKCESVHLEMVLAGEDVADAGTFCRATVQFSEKMSAPDDWLEKHLNFYRFSGILKAKEVWIEQGLDSIPVKRSSTEVEFKQMVLLDVENYGVPGGINQVYSLEGWVVAINTESKGETHAE